MLPISNVSDASHDRIFINAMLQYLDHLKYYLHNFSLIPSAYQPYPLLWQINITCTKQLLAVQQHHMLFFQTNLNLSSIFYAGDNAQHFTLGTLRKVLKVLLAAARVLPEDEVPYTVARRLFGLEQFVDFEASDPVTRSHLLSAAFELLDVAWQRSIPVGFLPCP